MELTDHLKDKDVRREVFRQSFPLFFAYHFWWQLKEFHLSWSKSLQEDINTFIEWFRWSRKTTIVRWFVVWCICYKIEPYIIWQSYEDVLSGESVLNIAKMLMKSSIVMDYWMLFPFESKREDMLKKSLSNFETTNWVKLESKSLWQTLRGANKFDMETEMSTRPTLLICDDIDTEKSVASIALIEKNERKILSETIGALDPLKRKIIFLGNTINEDWVVPRFRRLFENNERWNVFRQPLINENGANVRPEVFTNEVVEELMGDGKMSWNQNYLLIPATSGSGVFLQHYFDYFLASDFEKEGAILKKEDLICSIAIDPAISTWRHSDEAVATGMGAHKITNYYYLLEGYAGTTAPSVTIQAIIVMYNNMESNGFKPEYISVEHVAINKDQSKFIDLLKKELILAWITVPVILYESKVKKEARIQLNLEWPMSKQQIKFNNNMRDPEFVPWLIRQLLQFPNANHDDKPDCLSQQVEVFESRRNIIKKKPSWPKERYIIDPRTWLRRPIYI